MTYRLRNSITGDEGFSLTEFMLSSLVFLVIAASTFGVLGQTEQTASNQKNLQGPLDNARIAMETLTRIIQQAGNNPIGPSMHPIIITGPTQVQVRSDLTGSAGADRGDPDGDTDDVGEDVVIRYNAAAGSIELLEGASTQTIANEVSAFAMQYYDGSGAITAVGDEVRRIRITLTVRSPLPDPQTRRIFSMQLRSDVQLAALK
jgi:Tfp pilus assembly protein PilW